jgi:glycosyltransferase involved in cell wall biosynthesis
MKVTQLSLSDIVGGGGFRAAYRVHHALRRHDIDSTMVVSVKGTDDWTVQQIPNTKASKFITQIRSRLGGFCTKLLLRTANQVSHSPAVVPSGWPNRLNRSDTDIVHLHWVNGEMLSIADIGKLEKPVVWTLHDMWAFCGAEHYTDEDRYQKGYLKNNRPSYEGGFDLNRWTWSRKRKHWQRAFHIVTPSQWLANCVLKSALMRDWPVTVVPNTIDTEFWQPFDKNLARKCFHLPTDIPLLLFGAGGGTRNPRKGFDLLQFALDHLRGQLPGLELVIFGQSAPKEQIDLGFPVHYVGCLQDELSLRLVYCAADAMVIPSRQDNLPNTGLESHACGTPVIAFSVGGLSDIVDHLKTGYLAKPFDTVDLAKGIYWAISDENRLNSLSTCSRQKAIDNWSPHIVVKSYEKIYQNILENNS